MLSLWLGYRGNGMSVGHLPFAGGAAEQPAALMAAFDEMSAAAAKINERFSGKKRGDG